MSNSIISVVAQDLSLIYSSVYNKACSLSTADKKVILAVIRTGTFSVLYFTYQHGTRALSSHSFSTFLFNAVFAGVAFLIWKDLFTMANNVEKGMKDNQTLAKDFEEVYQSKQGQQSPVTLTQGTTFPCLWQRAADGLMQS